MAAGARARLLRRFDTRDRRAECIREPPPAILYCAALPRSLPSFFRPRFTQPHFTKCRSTAVPTTPPVVIIEDIPKTAGREGITAAIQKHVPRAEFDRNKKAVALTCRFCANSHRTRCPFFSLLCVNGWVPKPTERVSGQHRQLERRSVVEVDFATLGTPQAPFSPPHRTANHDTFFATPTYLQRRARGFARRVRAAPSA